MKNYIKKSLAIILILSIMICLENVNVVSAATKPIKGNWLRTMTVGDTDTFTVNGAKGYTVTWNSNKTTIAEVEKTTGLVTAIKAGSTKISATIIKGKTKVTLSGNVNVEAARRTLVSTQYGRVKGVQKGKNLNWYSIPYAANPEGDLRWNKPQNPVNWSSTLDCSKYSTTNTLNLDVCTSNEDKSNLPVFVFFHGGGNRGGSSSEFTGKDMVINEDCIVVSVNYRLGLLGFNCLPALQTEADSTGNYALLDMQKSLQWVKDNIENFGGNPNNITVSGQSAGGRNVMVMLISPIFKGLFQKAIVGSGGMTTSDVEKSASQIAYFLAPVAVKDGKAATEEEAKAWLLTSGNDVKEYLYSLSDSKLFAALGSAGITMSAFPHLFTDGVTIPKEGFNTTQYNDVPVIMITGTDEFSGFNNGMAYSDGSIPKDELKAAMAFGNKYGSMMYGYFNITASAQSMVANGYKSPIYLMDFNFGHDMKEWPEFALGSYHCVDSVFLESKLYPKSMAIKGAKQLHTMFNGYIKDFMWNSTGNPNSAERTIWTEFTTSNQQWLVLDATQKAAFARMLNSDFNSYEPIFKLMDADTTVSSTTKLIVIQKILIGRWFSNELDIRYKSPNLWY